MIDIKVMASGSSGNCYRIDDGKSQLLLDAGIPYPRIQEGCGFRVHEIAGCLVTHEHGDHSKAVPKLVARGVPVFGPLRLEILYPGVKGLEPVKKVGIGTYDVVPFVVEHDVECYGYFIRSLVSGDCLVYATDLASMPYGMEAEYWMIEANHSHAILEERVRAGEIDAVQATRVWRTHMSMETLMEYMKERDLQRIRQIYLLHLSDRNSNAQEFMEKMERLSGAEVYIA